MRSTLIIIFAAISFSAFAQDTTSTINYPAGGNATVNKDVRLNTVAKKEAEFNDANNALSGGNIAKGYRLIVVSTNDRAYAMKIRSKLLQNYPEQKVYMSFQPPYIKIKFGDFIDREEAEQYKSSISDAKIITTNIYIVSELVEVKPDKNSQQPN